jgi:hypothetical protein
MKGNGKDDIDAKAIGIAELWSLHLAAKHVELLAKD